MAICYCGGYGCGGKGGGRAALHRKADCRCGWTAPLVNWEQAFDPLLAPARAELLEKPRFCRPFRCRNRNPHRCGRPLPSPECEIFIGHLAEPGPYRSNASLPAKKFALRRERDGAGASQGKPKSDIVGARPFGSGETACDWAITSTSCRATIRNVLKPRMAATTGGSRRSSGARSGKFSDEPECEAGSLIFREGRWPT